METASAESAKAAEIAAPVQIAAAPPSEPVEPIEPAAASSAAPLAGPRPGIVAIRWKTQEENEVYGFNVMRSTSPDGPFVKANPSIIRGAGASKAPHSYAFDDQGVEAGKTYYYFLEEVRFSGERRKLSATQPQTARPLQ